MNKVGEKRLRHQPKEYLRKHKEVTGKQRSEDLSIYQPYKRPFVPFPVTFQCQITCRVEVILMVSILSLFFGIVYAYRARTYSVVTSLGVLVWLIVLRGTKQLYFHFIGFSLTLYPASAEQFYIKKKQNKENHVILMA